MLKSLFVVLLLAVAGLGVLVSMQPDEFRVTRSMGISAPVAVIFPLVNNQAKWALWSPWDKLDPGMQKTLEGTPAGVGSIAKWSGNSKVGKGTSTIIESKPNEVVRFRLDFEAPMKATDTAELTFRPKGNVTLVTWTMYGPASFMSKAMNLAMNCEKMVGEQFNDGLKNLKQVSEAEAKAAAAAAAAVQAAAPAPVAGQAPVAGAPVAAPIAGAVVPVTPAGTVVTPVVVAPTAVTPVAPVAAPVVAAPAPAAATPPAAR